MYLMLCIVFSPTLKITLYAKLSGYVGYAVHSTVFPYLTDECNLRLIPISLKEVLVLFSRSQEFSADMMLKGLSEQEASSARLSLC